jgi:hypothetical protein
MQLSWNNISKWKGIVSKRKSSTIVNNNQTTKITWNYEGSRSINQDKTSETRGKITIASWWYIDQGKSWRGNSFTED